MVYTLHILRKWNMRVCVSVRIGKVHLHYSKAAIWEPFPSRLITSSEIDARKKRKVKNCVSHGGVRRGGEGLERGDVRGKNCSSLVDFFFLLIYI